MAYQLQANEVKIALGGIDYVVTKTSLASEFVIKSAIDGSAVQVPLDVAARLFGAGRAWTILEKWFDVHHIEANPTHWARVAETAIVVHVGTSALSLLGSLSGPAIQHHLNPAGTPAAAAAALESAALEYGPKGIELFVAAAGVQDAGMAMAAAKAGYDQLKAYASSGAALPFEQIAATIDRASASLSNGQVYVRAITTIAGFDDSVGDDLVVFTSAFFDSFKGILPPLHNSILTSAQAIETVVDLQDQLDALIALSNSDAVRYQPLTRAGLVLSQTQLRTSPVVDLDLPLGALPPANGTQAARGVTYGSGELSGLGDAPQTIMTYVGVILDDVIHTGAGNDRITVGGGWDVVQGGAGTDTLIIDYGWAGIRNIQTDVFPGGGQVQYALDYDFEVPEFRIEIEGVRALGIENFVIYGTRGNDRIETFNGSDKIFGGAGDDILRAGAGSDILAGGEGNDTLDPGEGLDQVDGGSGFDILLLDRSSATKPVYFNADAAATPKGTKVAGTSVSNIEATVLLTGAGNDVITLSSARADTNVVLTGGGNDRISVNRGRDIVFGGDGNDRLTIDFSWMSEAISSGSGYGGGGAYFSGDHYAYGNNQAEVVFAAIESVTIHAGTGGDRITTYDGKDHVDGGAGDDCIKGGGGRDTLLGGSGSDRLEGEDGDDDLQGGSGDDIIYGGAGNDTLDGGAGVDALAGGAGNDRYVIDDGADSIVELAQEGTDSVHSSATYMLSDNIEVLTLTGTAHVDGAGSAGANTIKGNGGNNTLSAGAGNDTVDGAAGNDIHIGGTGRDNLTGGAGADAFRFDDGDSGKTTGTRDWVKDFSTADGDVIDLSLIDADTSTVGDDAFNFIGSNAFSKTAGELRMVAEGANWVVQGDVNGDGVADFSILVTAQGLPPAANDFMP